MSKRTELEIDSAEHRLALGRAVRRMRISHEFEPSQARVSLAGGFNKNFVGQVENGRANISFESLVRLCIGLDCSMSDLIDMYEDKLAGESHLIVVPDSD